MSRVAVIGAGIGGLATVKSLLEEGLDAVGFETNDDVGGVWAYRDTLEGHPTVMNCTIMNSSKELSAFSDFPPPASSFNFMHHTAEKEYLTLYAQHFGLMDHIKLRHRVEAVRPTEDHSRTGRWNVTVLNLETGHSETTTFDAVVVCSGKHSKPRIPKLPGLSEFSGRVTHSSQYKTSDSYKGKKVLVVGIGNSAADLAVEISSVAKKVYLSTRSGAWLFGRMGKGGLPGDSAIFTRLKLTLYDWLPYNWSCSYVERLLSMRVNHSFFQLKPAHRALSHYPTITDDLPMKLVSGQVLLRKDVDSFQETSVRFKDEPSETVDIDEVVLATGFLDHFPFLEPEHWPVKDRLLDLFQYTFPPKADHHTLAFVGMAYAFGPQAPVLEMQGRWIARVLSGKCRLPSSKTMLQHIESERSRVLQRFGPGSLLNGQKDWLPYLDQMAGYIGAKPSLWRIMLWDPRLVYNYIFGPALPYAYRLRGPHAWPGARDAIMKVNERISGLRPSEGQVNGIKKNN